MIFFLLSCTQTDKNVAQDTTPFEDALVAAIEQDMLETGATAFSMAVLKEGAVSWSGGFGKGTKDSFCLLKPYFVLHP